jgi:predicted amidohydrolase YtcJ
MSSIPQSDKAQPPITIFTAKKIVTMDDSLPYATAVAVSEGRILAVGTLESMAPWCEGREVQFNKQFEGNVLLPGLIDNHVHPW